MASMDALKKAANQAVMNKHVKPADNAPDVKGNPGVALQVSKKDQQEKSLVSRQAYHVGDQLFIQDTFMDSKGNMKEEWLAGTQTLHI